MRHTLEQLEEIVPKILQKGLVNKAFEGYPILHRVAMELSDQSNHAKHPRYLKLIQNILQDPGCNPDILDQHGKSLLMYAAERGNVPLLRLLLQYKAEPNLIDKGSKMTALEWGIYINPRIYINPASPVVKYLIRFTKITDKVLTNSNELFEKAIEEKEINWINVLLELKLVRYQKLFRANIVSSAEVPKAFWMRVVADPENERAILKVRERLSDTDLARLRHKEITRDSDPNYTPYSPCTLVRQGIPISLFSSLGTAALMIRATSDRIPYWYDGHSEELTSEMSFREGSRLTHRICEVGQYWEVTAKQIQSEVEKLYVAKVREYQRDQVENPEKYDNHGVLLDKYLSEIAFTWNEGLLRYKRSQIFGIHVDVEDKQSVLHGFKLRKALNLDVPFYYYHPKLGTTKRINIDALLRKWKLVSMSCPPKSRTLMR